jgi:hypothetical protein
MRAVMDLPPMPPDHVRVWYLLNAAQIREIDRDLRDQGVSPHQRAVRAYEHRRWARVVARSAMTTELRKHLDDRDRDRYGQPDGPTFEQVIAHLSGKGVVHSELFEEVVRSASRTDEGYTSKVGELALATVEGMANTLREEIKRQEPSDG